MNKLDARCGNSNTGCNAILFEVNGAPVMALFVDNVLVGVAAVNPAHA